MMRTALLIAAVALLAGCSVEPAGPPAVANKLDAQVELANALAIAKSDGKSVLVHFSGPG